MEEEREVEKGNDEKPPMTQIDADEKKERRRGTRRNRNVEIETLSAVDDDTILAGYRQRGKIYLEDVFAGNLPVVYR